MSVQSSTTVEWREPMAKSVGFSMFYFFFLQLLGSWKLCEKIVQWQRWLECERVEKMCVIASYFTFMRSTYVLFHMRSYNAKNWWFISEWNTIKISFTHFFFYLLEITSMSVCEIYELEKEHSNECVEQRTMKFQVVIVCVYKTFLFARDIKVKSYDKLSS